VQAAPAADHHDVVAFILGGVVPLVLSECAGAEMIYGAESSFVFTRVSDT
jgi:hypothetical protein